MTIATHIMSWLTGRLLGRDEFANRYYESRIATDAFGRRKRWVLYNGMAEASKVPPMWHRWLHYTTDDLPASVPARYFWQRVHVPNLSGTDYAYFPPGHVKAGAKRHKARGDYQAWNPPVSQQEER
jgi:NADH:ubiquinone oxidoreductase subunit